MQKKIMFVIEKIPKVPSSAKESFPLPRYPLQPRVVRDGGGGGGGGNIHP